MVDLAQGLYEDGVVKEGDFDGIRARYELTRSQLRTLVEGMPQLVWRSCDLGNWTWASPQWLNFTGQTQQESHGRGWLDVVHPDDHAAVLDAWSRARANGMLDVEFRVRRVSDGVYMWHHTRSAPVRDMDGRIVEWLGTTTDIQDLKTLQQRQAALIAEVQTHARSLEAEILERKRAEAKLSYAAFHDDLTGLHNRTFFMGALRRVLSEPGNGLEHRSAVLIMDLDRFKSINDSFGHGAGDTLLKVMGSRLLSCVRTGDTLARIGGDEFGMVILATTDAELAERTNEVLDQFRRPAWFGRRQIATSCSLGGTWVSSGHHTPEELLQEADTAMYEVKRLGRGGFQAFAAPMRVRALELLDLHTELRVAVSRSELELHYQPIWDTKTDAVGGFEALVRWRNPRLGLLQPGDFIPLAEERGLIRDIGRWVLAEACEQLARWRAQYPGRRLTLSVNVCSEELKDPGYVPHLETILTGSGAQPNQLELEITESVLLEHSARVQQTLASVRALGVRVAIDDFGVGFSSLSYLDRYEVDTVKIDRSFTDRMIVEKRTQAIIAAVLELGRALSFRVVAEGVESVPQLEALHAAGCPAVQGYLISRPAPPDDFASMLAEQPAAPAASSSTFTTSASGTA